MTGTPAKADRINYYGGPRFYQRRLRPWLPALGADAVGHVCPDLLTFFAGKIR
jgi:hypothetical protein